MIKPSAIQGWLVKGPVRVKKICWNMPVLDLELSFGGFDTTLGRVSRMDVLEGMMSAPDSVVSQ